MSKNYSRMADDFPKRAAARSRYLKNAKECAIVIQDFDLAACLRDAQKRMEAYIPKRQSKIVNRKS